MIKTVDLSDFYVITPISNSANHDSRYDLYWKFKAMCEAAEVNLITVEQAFGERRFGVTEPGNPNHIQLRTVEELWHKENMINIGVSHIMRMFPNAKYVAWVDADCFPMCPPREWFEATWHQLQHYMFVQMWEYLINFGPDYQPISGPQMSFMRTYAANGYTVPKGQNVKHTLAGNSGSVALGRPGLAWAASIEAFNLVGRLIDFCILGSGDWHMAHALVGAMDQGSWEANQLSEYSKALFEWQVKAERWIKRDVGFVSGTVGHWFHGDKVNRQYGSRGKILIDNKYNPKTDIKYDSQGLVQLETWEPRQIVLRDKIRAYFKARNEDSIPLRD